MEGHRMTSTQSKMASGRKTLHRTANTGLAFWGPGDTYNFLATGRETQEAYFQLEAVVTPGGGPPPHIHHREDETFYLIEGILELRLGDLTVLARPGDYISVPRGTVHSFRNITEHAARMLVTFVPAGFEGFFQEVFEPAADRTSPPPPTTSDLIDRMVKAAAKYGLEMLPPPDSSL
jgi:quercetin dioxygenase-like cupin family protein